MAEKILVVYHYFERDKVYRENFLHFLTYGYSSDLDFLIVIAGTINFRLPELPNIQYVFTENKNYDFGGYAFVVTNTINEADYSYFIFVNSSVRGPYLKPEEHQHWSQLLIRNLNNDIGLVGTTINILAEKTLESIAYKEKYGGNPPFSHVQTMVYAMSRQVLQMLKSNSFYDIHGQLSRIQLISDYEIHMSQLVLQHGWNIRCLLPEYNQIDYRKSHHNINLHAKHGDPNIPKGYFGNNLKPEDIMFVKTHRGIYAEEFLLRLSIQSLGRVKEYRESLFIDSTLKHYISRLEALNNNRLCLLAFIFLRQVTKHLDTWNARFSRILKRIISKDFWFGTSQ